MKCFSDAFIESEFGAFDESSVYERQSSATIAVDVRAYSLSKKLQGFGPLYLDPAVDPITNWRNQHRRWLNLHIKGTFTNYKLSIPVMIDDALVCRQVGVHYIDGTFYPNYPLLDTLTYYEADNVYNAATGVPSFSGVLQRVTDIQDVGDGCNTKLVAIPGNPIRSYPPPVFPGQGSQPFDSPGPPITNDPDPLGSRETITLTTRHQVARDGFVPQGNWHVDSTLGQENSLQALLNYVLAAVDKKGMSFIPWNTRQNAYFKEAGNGQFFSDAPGGLPRISPGNDAPVTIEGQFWGLDGSLYEQGPGAPGTVGAVSQWSIVSFPIVGVVKAQFRTCANYIIVAALVDDQLKFVNQQLLLEGEGDYKTPIDIPMPPGNIPDPVLVGGVLKAYTGRANFAVVGQTWQEYKKRNGLS